MILIKLWSYLGGQSQCMYCKRLCPCHSFSLLSLTLIILNTFVEDNAYDVSWPISKTEKVLRDVQENAKNFY